MKTTILTGDCVERMRELPTDSIEMALTSPPYDSARTYHGHSWDFEATARELYRVLMPGGVLCWNVGDMIIEGGESLTSAKQKIFFVEQSGFRIHQTLLYQKRNFSHPDAARYHRVFEYVIVLSKGQPRTWNPIMDRPNLTAGKVGNLGVNTFTERDGSKSQRRKTVTAEMGKRHDVWLGNTRGQEDMCEALSHPAMMPKWLARDLILSWSNAGDTVLDCFAGSFTTCVQAVGVGRNTIGIEASEEYCEIGRRALANSNYGLALA